jgi:hypothetical protein
MTSFGTVWLEFRCCCVRSLKGTSKTQMMGRAGPGSARIGRQRNAPYQTRPCTYAIDNQVTAQCLAGDCMTESALWRSGAGPICLHDCGAPYQVSEALPSFTSLRMCISAPPRRAFRVLTANPQRETRARVRCGWFVQWLLLGTEHHALNTPCNHTIH